MSAIHAFLLGLAVGIAVGIGGVLFAQWLRRRHFEKISEGNRL